MSSTETDACTAPPVRVGMGPPRDMRTVVRIGADKAVPHVAMTWPRHLPPPEQPTYLPEPYAARAWSRVSNLVPSMDLHGAHVRASLISEPYHSPIGATSSTRNRAAACAADSAPPSWSRRNRSVRLGGALSAAQ